MTNNAKAAVDQHHQIPSVRGFSFLSVQSELIPVDGTVTGPEYQASLLNENVYLPEVMLRYLIYMITSDKTPEEVRNFALHSRNELNAQGIERLRRSARQLVNVDH